MPTTSRCRSCAKEVCVSTSPCDTLTLIAKVINERYLCVDRAAAFTGDRTNASPTLNRLGVNTGRREDAPTRHRPRQPCNFRSTPTFSRNPKISPPAMTLPNSLPTLRGAGIVMQVHFKRRRDASGDPSIRLRTNCTPVNQALPTTCVSLDFCLSQRPCYLSRVRRMTQHRLRTRLCP